LAHKSGMQSINEAKKEAGAVRGEYGRKGKKGMKKLHKKSFYFPSGQGKYPTVFRLTRRAGGKKKKRGNSVGEKS